MNKSIFVFGIFTVLAACAPIQSHQTDREVTTVSNLDTLKELVIDGEKYTNFSKWACRDYVHDEKIALEVVKTDKGIGDLMENNIQDYMKETPIKNNKNEELTQEQKEQLGKIAEEVAKKVFEKYTLGYILYDGNSDYERAFYSREGINRRWAWGGKEIEDYVFIIRPDGTGLYYDFTNLKKGDSTKAKGVFRCEKVY